MPRISLLLLGLLCVLNGHAQRFEDFFEDRTLRLDYSFSGDNRHQQIALDELLTSPGWFGRRVNLNRLLLQGNGQLTMTDTLGRDTLYRHSFSTLFQEWQTTEEATRLWKSFENVFLVPMPRRPVLMTVTLTDTHHRVTGRLTHRIDPADILIRPMAPTPAPWRYLRRAADID